METQTFVKQTNGGFEVHVVTGSTVYATLTNKADADKVAALLMGSVSAAPVVKNKGGRPKGAVAKAPVVAGAPKNKGGRPKKNRDLELAANAQAEPPVLELAHNAPYDGGEKVDETRLAALVGAPG